MAINDDAGADLRGARRAVLFINIIVIVVLLALGRLIFEGWNAYAAAAIFIIWALHTRYRLYRLKSAKERWRARNNLKQAAIGLLSGAAMAWLLAWPLHIWLTQP